MSDPLALISVCASIVSLSGTVLLRTISLRDTTDLLGVRWQRKVKLLKQYKLSVAMYILLLPITDTLTMIEKNVLQAKDGVVLDYRARRMAGCSMTGVSAALIAGVTNSSLQSGYTSELPWIVRALWTCALTFSLLSTYYSFLLHQYLTSFSTAQDIRHAFTHRTFRRKNTQDVKLPSLAVALRLCIPPYLVSLAIGCYITTLGLYWGFAWTQWWRFAEEPVRGVENRNVFIFFILATVIATVMYTVPIAIGAIAEDLDSLRLVRGGLGDVHQASSVEVGRRTDEQALPGHNRNDSPGPPRGFSYLEIIGSAAPTYHPMDIAANEPLRGVGAAVAALLAASEAHRNAGIAIQKVATELKQLTDSLENGKRGPRSGNA